MLHNWRIEPREYERHEARRGRRHAFERLDPRRTALVVIDMVPFFLDENAYARGIVPNIQSLAAALRSSGGTIAWVLPGAEEPSAMKRELLGPNIAERYRHSGGEGTLRDRLWHEFELSAEDVVVEKTASSAFFPGRCELPSLLEQRHIDTVLITGTVAMCAVSLRLGMRALWGTA